MSLRLWKHRITDILDSIRKIQSMLKKWDSKNSRMMKKQSTPLFEI